VFFPAVRELGAARWAISKLKRSRMSAAFLSSTESTESDKAGIAHLTWLVFLHTNRDAPH